MFCRYGPQLSAIPHLLSRYFLFLFCFWIYDLPSITLLFSLMTGITLSINNSASLSHAEKGNRAPLPRRASEIFGAPKPLLWPFPLF
jgi:hypothetical protein